LITPYGIAVDGHRHVFIADAADHQVQQVSLPSFTEPIEQTATNLVYYTTTSGKQAHRFMPTTKLSWSPWSMS
jgi:hypothetical protein